MCQQNIRNIRNIQLADGRQAVQSSLAVTQMLFEQSTIGRKSYFQLFLCLLHEQVTDTRTFDAAAELTRKITARFSGLPGAQKIYTRQPEWFFRLSWCPEEDWTRFIRSTIFLR